MWIFISAGLLYLLGVSILLFVKPNYMFTPDGQWKEFGIGQNPERYTAFPFWLFCIVWALVSYFIVLLLAPFFAVKEIHSEVTKRRRNINQAMLEEVYDLNESVSGDVVDLPRGYYVLNRKASKLAGTPKYVYLGPEQEP